MSLPTSTKEPITSILIMNNGNDNQPFIHREFTGQLTAVSNHNGTALFTFQTPAGRVQVHNRGDGWHRQFILLMTAHQVAELLNCGQSTVYRLAKDGRLPHLKTHDGQYLFDENDIREFARTYQPTKRANVIKAFTTGLFNDNWHGQDYRRELLKRNLRSIAHQRPSLRPVLPAAQSQASPKSPDTNTQVTKET